MTSSRPIWNSKLTSLVACFLSILSILSHATAQSIGSFNTVIYLNGAPLSPSQISCSGYEYCCNSGQACAWDDAGQPACCANSWTCTGTVAAAGQWQQTQAVVQTQTVYESRWSSDCRCQTTTTPTVIAPAVVVPQTATTTVQQYWGPTTTTTPYLYTSTTTTPTAQAAAGGNGNCAGGYTTVTEVNVGQPTRTVGCYIIINGGAQSNGKGWYERWTWLLGVASISGLLLKQIFW